MNHFYAASVLLHKAQPSGGYIYSHLLHTGSHKDSSEAIAAAICAAQQKKPHLDVIQVICLDTNSGSNEVVDVIDNQVVVDITN